MPILLIIRRFSCIVLLTSGVVKNVGKNSSCERFGTVPPGKSLCLAFGERTLGQVEGKLLFSVSDGAWGTQRIRETSAVVAGVRNSSAVGFCWELRGHLGLSASAGLFSVGCLGTGTRLRSSHDTQHLSGPPVRL